MNVMEVCVYFRILPNHSLVDFCFQPIMQTLKKRGLLNPSESPISMHPYRPQMVMKGLRPHQAAFYTSLAKLGSLARGMLYLVSYLVPSNGVVKLDCDDISKAYRLYWSLL